MEKEIISNLKDLGLNENEIKVYLALTKLGEAAASRIAKAANLPRTTTISILEKMKMLDYLSSHIYNGMNYYWIESPMMFKESLQNKLKIAEELGKYLGDLYRAESDFPSAQIFDSAKSIRSFIEKTVLRLKKNSILRTIDLPSAGNYRRVLSDGYEKKLLELKNKKNICTHTLVPRGMQAGIEPEKLKAQNIIIREMPEGIDFKSSLWIMDDSIVHFSGRYPFVVSIRHKVIMESMKSLYEYLWAISK